MEYETVNRIVLLEMYKLHEVGAILIWSFAVIIPRFCAAGSLGDQPSPDAHQLLPLRHDDHPLLLRPRQGATQQGQGRLHTVYLRQGQWAVEAWRVTFLLSSEDDCCWVLFFQEWPNKLNNIFNSPGQMKKLYNEVYLDVTATRTWNLYTRLGFDYHKTIITYEGLRVIFGQE